MQAHVAPIHASTILNEGRGYRPTLTKQSISIHSLLPESREFRKKVKNSTEVRKRQFSTLIILPVMGFLSLVSRIPFFFIKQPFAIFYPPYSAGGRARLPAVTEVVDGGTGIFFGIWFAAIGGFLIYLYIRIKSDSKNNCPHCRKGLH